MSTAHPQTIAKTLVPPEPAPVPSANVPSQTRTPKRRWWVYPIIALVVIGFVWWVIHLVHASQSRTSAEGQKAKQAHDLPVMIAKAQRGDLDQFLIGLGNVTPLNTVTVKSRVDGAIVEIGFTEGQMVKEGDFLLQIDPGPYNAALKQAQGQLAKDTAAKTSADWNVQQDQLALKDKGISEQQLRNDQATRDQAAGAMEVDQAAIDNAKINLAYAHITSPISGRIGLRLVDKGNIVHASDQNGLAVITQLQPISVIFTLPEDNIAQIQRQQPNGQPMVVDAYDRDWTHKLATGTVLAIDNQIDPTTGTVRIKAQFDNKDNSLYPSQFVNARLLVNTIHNAVLIPTAGIQHSPTSTFAYVLTAKADDNADDATTKPAARGAGGIHGTVAMREITVGPSQAAIGSDGVDTSVVRSGLEPGDIVVTDGVDKLQNGSGVVGRFPQVKPPTTGPATTGPTAMSATTRPGSRRGRKNTE